MYSKPRHTQCKKYTYLKDCIAIVFGVFFSVSNIYALDSISLTVAEITADNWSLKNAVVTITDINQTPRISLESASLILPPPLQQFTSLGIQCQQFNWQENYLACSKGRGQLNFSKFKALPFDFSLQVKNEKSQLKISHLPLFAGEISIDVQERAGKWQLGVQAKGLDLAELNAMLSTELVNISSGLADFDVELKGDQAAVQAFFMTAMFKQVSLEEPTGRVAAEKIMLVTELSALKQEALWEWHHTASLVQGGLYIEPVYLEINKKNGMTCTAKGVWQPEQQSIQVDQFKLVQLGVLQLQANALLNYQTKPNIEVAELSVHIPQLKSMVADYLLPFLESSAFSAIDLTGTVDMQMTVKQDEISQASITVKNLGLDDAEKKIYMHQANAQIHWAKQRGRTQNSFINWQQLKIQAIPFQAGQLDFIAFDQQFKLLKQADLAVLDGILSINQFSFVASKGSTDTSVHFTGSVNTLSLEQLSTALNWTPLSGTISGDIPSVRYQDKILSLGGELKIQVFDGEVRINNLALSGLFSDFPQFYSDIAIDHLDLGAITHQFDTGHIEGRLSGTVQNLYLENWHPVSFYAWIGTPEGDNSRHRISQRAVENIASIGGGGVSDVLSRGFLGLFSTFGYRSLGFGCYLHQGVCQLMGGAAVKNGFYLIEGSGLPRINVIGYNTKLDWNIFLESLSRIGTSDEVIVE